VKPDGKTNENTSEQRTDGQSTLSPPWGQGWGYPKMSHDETDKSLSLKKGSSEIKERQGIPKTLMRFLNLLLHFLKRLRFFRNYPLGIKKTPQVFSKTLLVFSNLLRSFSNLLQYFPNHVQCF